MMLDPLVAGYVVWIVWGASWLAAAAAWAGRRQVRAGFASYRVQLGLAIIGYACLFAMVEPPHARLWLLRAWLGWSMVAAIAIGMALAWWARIHLGALWSAGITRREGHRIVDSGPYALVRHPIYTGIILGAIGLAAIKATPLALAGALLIAIGFATKARVEERFLGAELGEADYVAYRARVPMLVPFAPTHS